MTTWQNFYILLGTAAATLLGLMFIAVTFGQKLVTAQTVGLARGILSPIFFHFVHVFLIASAALFPTNDYIPIALVSVGAGLFKLATIPSTIKQLKRASDERYDIEFSDWMFGAFLPVALYLVFAVAGVFLLFGARVSVPLIGIASVAALVLGVVSAWDMLLWMASQVELAAREERTNAKRSV